MTRLPSPVVGEVVVLIHAVEKAQARHADFADLSIDEARAEIAARVRLACERGQVYDIKPRHLRSYGEPKATLPAGQRVVTDGEKWGFIIDVAQAPKITVVTALKRLDRAMRA